MLFCGKTASLSKLNDIYRQPTNLLGTMTMLNQELSGEDYSIAYDADMVTVKFSGQLILRGYENYAFILALLMEIAASRPAEMTLDLREVIFLNSSGITMFAKFLLSLRQQTETRLVVRVSRTVPWQSESFGNMPKLLPRVQLRIE